MRSYEQHFNARVSAFLRRTGLSRTAFGMLAVGDPNLLRQIARGRSPTLRTVDRVRAFMAAWDGEAGGTRDPPRRRRPGRPGSRARRARRTTRSEAMREQTKDRKASPPVRFLRLPEVMARTGLSRSTIYVRLAEGRFPRPVRLGPRAVGWIESEIDAWMQERIDRSRDGGDEAAR